MIKLIFLCGSLEAGKDGVGDYTRRLGLELANQGHEVKLVALNDSVTVEHLETAVVNKSTIEVIRFPSTLTWVNRFEKLDRLFNVFRPDWISLQYVPYSFQKKGVPYQFAAQLKKISRDRNLHIMFHETWIGFNSVSSVKHKLVGSIQRNIAKIIVTDSKAKKISTSNRLYQLVLSKADINASIVPLFSNIPFHTLKTEFRIKLLDRLQIDIVNREEYIFLGLFGTMHKGWDLEEAIEREKNKAKSQGKKLVFLSLGRIGDVKEFNRLKFRLQSEVIFLLVGELSEQEVSSTLQCLDMAISCTPREYLGKSGVYAAMRLHGLEVLVPFSEIIPEYSGEILKHNEYLNSRTKSEWGVASVATQFINFLESNY